METIIISAFAELKHSGELLEKLVAELNIPDPEDASKVIEENSKEKEKV